MNIAFVYMSERLIMAQPGPSRIANPQKLTETKDGTR